MAEQDAAVAEAAKTEAAAAAAKAAEAEAGKAAEAAKKTEDQAAAPASSPRLKESASEKPKVPAPAEDYERRLSGALRKLEEERKAKQELEERLRALEESREAEPEPAANSAYVRAVAQAKYEMREEMDYLNIQGDSFYQQHREQVEVWAKAHPEKGWRDAVGAVRAWFPEGQNGGGAAGGGGGGAPGYRASPAGPPPKAVLDAGDMQRVTAMAGVMGIPMEEAEKRYRARIGA